MPRLMYDAVTASNIPRDAKMVAGYVDKIKLEPWSPADWKLFPNATKVEIVKKASSNWGHVLDVEPGDATPVQAPGWVKMRRLAGFANPTIYCNLSTWPSVQQAFRDQNITQPLYWIAKYDDVKNFPVLNGITAIAKQYHGNDPNGFDISWVNDFWPGVDGVDMPLTQDDVNLIWNGGVPNKTNGRTDPAKELLGWTNFEAYNARLNTEALSRAIAALKDIIIANEANDLTEAKLNEALDNLIQANFVPAVVSAVDLALKDKELNVDSAELSAIIISGIRELTFKAV